MYTSSYGYSNSNRKVTAKFYYIGSGGSFVELDSSNGDIQNISLSENLSSNQCISMGSPNSSKIQVELINVPKSVKSKIYKGKKIKVEICSTVGSNEYATTLGHYYIDEITWSEYHNKTNYYSAKIIAYDGFYKTDVSFTVPTSSKTILEIIQLIAQKCGLTLDSSKWSSSITISSFPEESSCRTMIGYLAGMQGTIPYFDRDGNLSCKWYSTSSKIISCDEIYENSMNFISSSDSENGEVITIKNIESGTGNNLFYGNSSTGAVGTIISFENPLITQNLVTSIYTSKIYDGSYKISFTPLRLKWRGDATIEVGEILTVKDKFNNDLTFYVMERSLNYDGGLFETYVCYGENESTITFNPNINIQNLNRKLTNLENAIESASSVISQTTGSVFELISADDPDHPEKNSGWRLYSEDNDNVILANSGGIGFSTNGGESYNAASIYMDSDGGHIVATDIVAGLVSTDKLVVGSSSEEGTLSKYLSDNISDINGEISDLKDKKTSYVFTCPSSQTNVTKKLCYISPTEATGFKIVKGATIDVVFTYAAFNTSGSSTSRIKLILSQTGGQGCYKNDGSFDPNTYVVHSSDSDFDIDVYYNGSVVMANNPNLWSAYAIVRFVYDGTGWAMLNSNTDGVVDSSVDSAVSSALASNTSIMRIADYCNANNKTYIEGSKIYAGSIATVSLAAGCITSEKIASGSITTDKLSVGQGMRTEMFSNPQMDETLSAAKWNPYNCTIAPYGSGSGTSRFIHATPNSGAIYCDVTQNVYMEYGKCYRFIARFTPLGCTTVVSSDPNRLPGFGIYYLAGNHSIRFTGTNLNITPSSIGNNKEIIMSYSFKFLEDTGVTSVGLMWSNLRKNSTTNIDVNINWMSLTEIPESSLISSYPWQTTQNTWFTNDTAWQPYALDYYSAPDNYKKSEALTVDSSGSLNTLGSVSSTSGNIGLINFNDRDAIYKGFSSYPYSSDQRCLYFSTVQFKTPDDESKLADSKFLVRQLSPLTAGIKLESRSGFQNISDSVITKFDEADTDFSLITPAGVYIKTGGYECQLSANGIDSPSVVASSREIIKKNISLKTSSVLDMIKSSKIYEYNLKGDDDNAKLKTGFVVERETPEEIISDDGNGINLYSMCSMNWKATQELLSKIEAIEELLNGKDET